MIPQARYLAEGSSGDQLPETVPDTCTPDSSFPWEPSIGNLANQCSASWIPPFRLMTLPFGACSSPRSSSNIIDETHQWWDSAPMPPKSPNDEHSMSFELLGCLPAQAAQ